MLGQVLNKMKGRLAALLAMVMLLSASLTTVAFAVDYDEELAKLEARYGIKITLSETLEGVPEDDEHYKFVKIDKKKAFEIFSGALECFPPGLMEEMIADANSRRMSSSGEPSYVTFDVYPEYEYYYIDVGPSAPGFASYDNKGLSGIALSADNMARSSVSNVIDTLVHELAHGLNAYLESDGVTEREEIELAFKTFNGSFIYKEDSRDYELMPWKQACTSAYGATSYMEDIAELMTCLHRHPACIANELKNNDSIISKKKAYLERLLIQHTKSVQADTKIWKQVENSPQAVDSRVLTVNFNGEHLKFVPMQRDGQILVPLVQVLDKLNCVITYETDPSAVIGYRSGTTVKIVPGSADAYINGQLVKQSVIPMYPGNGTIMVSARFIAEAFGANVTWDPQTLTVNINTTH